MSGMAEVARRDAAAIVSRWVRTLGPTVGVAAGAVGAMALALVPLYLWAGVAATALGFGDQAQISPGDLTALLVAILVPLAAVLALLTVGLAAGVAFVVARADKGLAPRPLRALRAGVRVAPRLAVVLLLAVGGVAAAFVLTPFVVVAGLLALAVTPLAQRLAARSDRLRWPSTRTLVVLAIPFGLAAALALRWAMVLPAVAFERCSVRAAFARSRQLGGANLARVASVAALFFLAPVAVVAWVNATFVAGQPAEVLPQLFSMTAGLLLLSLAVVATVHLFEQFGGTLDLAATTTPPADGGRSIAAAVTVAVLAASLPALAAVPPAGALAPGATIVVDSLGDEPDAVPGDALCDTGTGACTLRAAIDEANLSSDEIIGFSVSGTITVGAPLFLQQPVEIDGAGERVVVSGGGTTAVFRIGMEILGGGYGAIRHLTVADGFDAVTGGAAFFVDGTSRGFTLDGVTVRDNTTPVGAMFGGALVNITNLTITNSTFMNNASDVTTDGSDVGNVFSGSVQITHSTFAGSAGSSSLASSGASFDVRNSVISAPAFACTGTITGSGNVVSDAAGICPGTAATAATMGLAGLADHGGDTDTVRLLPTSPAVDAADPAHCLTADQRGAPRPRGAACDAGAYELDPATTTTLSAAPNPANFGGGVTLDAAVAATGEPAVPTGSVEIFDGPTSLGTFPLDAAGSASTVLTTLTAGAHSLTAAYLPDAGLATSTSPAVPLTVDPAATAVTLVSSGSPSLGGDAVTFTATVTGAGGSVPTGAVTFLDGATALATVPLDGSGQAALTTATLAGGPHSLVADYAGDANHDPAASVPLGHDVVAATTTALTGPGAPTVYGNDAVFDVVVTPTGGGTTPTGLVVLLAGGLPVGSATLDPAGTASVTVTSLPPGANAVVASYGGDSYNAASDSPEVTQVVTAAATTVDLAVSPSPTTVFGTTLTLDVAVASPDSPAVPTGLVTVYDGPSAVVILGLESDGTATYPLSTLGAGTYALRVEYGGATGFVAGTSPTVAHQVLPATTVTGLASSSAASVSGEPVSLTATVTSTDSPRTPIGTVTFRHGTTDLGTATLDGFGVARLDTAAIPVGATSLTARYNGGPDFGGSTSAPLPHTVAPAPVAVVVVSAPDPSTFGSSVTVSVAVTAAPPGSGTPTGTVTIRDGASVVGAAALDGTGRASVPVTGLAVGAHTLHADYGGDAAFLPGTGSTGQTVDPDATTVVVFSSAPSQPFGRPVTFTAVVVGTGAATPTGPVTFRVGGRVLGTVALDGSGRADLTVAAPDLGSYTVAADYAGDGDFLPATGQVLQQITTGPTAVALAVTPSEPTVADPVTLTATVTAPGAASTPTGTVSFYDNGTFIGAAAVDASGQARLTRQFTRAFHDLEARFTGTTGWEPSTSPVVSIVPARTTSILASTVTPTAPQVGATVTLEFAPSVPAGVPLPTGVVHVSDGAGGLGSVPLIGGVATLTVPAPLVSGPWAVSAWYPGDLNYEPIPPTVVTVPVVAAPTAVAVVTTPHPGYALDGAVTVRAFVSSSFGDSPITGTVRFSSDSPVLGSTLAVVDASGMAEVTVFDVPAGTWTFTAEYLPGAGSAFATSTGSTTHASVKRPVTVRITGVTGLRVGQPTRVSVAVTDPLGGPRTPSGVVVIDGGAGVTCTASTFGACDLVFPATGPVTITATYAGDDRFGGGSDTTTGSVTTSTPTLRVFSPTRTWVTGDPITVSWTIGGPSTGTVTVRSPFGVVCTSTAVPSGSCTATMPFAQRGATFDFDVAYSGDDGWTPAVGSVGGTLVGCYPVPFSALPAAGGTVTGLAGNCNGGTGFVEGTRVTATAVAAPGFVHRGWLETDRTGRTHTFVVGEGARSATAIFEPDCVAVSYRTGPAIGTTSVPGATGYVDLAVAPDCGSPPAYDPSTGTTTVRYQRGTVLRVTAVARFPELGRFIDWSVQDSPFVATTVADPSLELTLTGDVDLTAHFGARCYQPAVRVDGSGAARIVTPFNCFDRTYGNGYLFGTSVQIQATPDPYHYVGATTVEGRFTVEPTAYAVRSDETVVVSLPRCAQLTLVTTGSGRGTVTPSVASTCPGGEPGWYRPGEISLQPVPAPAYPGAFGFEVPADRFKRWVDDLGIPISPRSWPLFLDMSVDRTVTAVFVSPSRCAGISLRSDNPAWIAGLRVSQAPEHECSSESEYLQGQPLTLTADALQGSPLVQWRLDGLEDFEQAAVSGRSDRIGARTRFGSHVPGDTTRITGMYGGVTATAYACAAIASEMALVNMDGTVAPGPAPDGFISFDSAPTCPGTGNGWLVGAEVGYGALAQPAGYDFLQWEGDVAGTEDEGVITLDGSRPVTVIRSRYQVLCYTLTVTPADRTVVGEDPNCPNTDPASNLYLGGTVVAVHTWDGGEVWVGWQGDVERSENPSWVYVDGDSTAHAKWRDKTVDEDIVDFFEDVGDALAVAGKKLVGVAILAASALLESAFTAVLGVISLVSMGVGAIAGALGAPTDSGFMEVMTGVQQTAALFSSPFSCGAEWAFSDGAGSSDGNTLEGTGGDLKDTLRDPRRLKQKMTDYRSSIEAIEERATGWAAAKKKFLVRAKVVKSGVGTGLTLAGVGIAAASTDFGWDDSAADAWGTESGRVFMSCMEDALPDYWGVPPLGFSDA